MSFSFNFLQFCSFLPNNPTRDGKNFW